MTDGWLQQEKRNLAKQEAKITNLQDRLLSSQSSAPRIPGLFDQWRTWRTVWSNLPLTPIGGLILYGLWSAQRRRRSEYRRRHHLCPACGYDLRSSTGHCPECGAPTRGEAHNKAVKAT